MGRTVPTFRQLIDDAIARWAKFRRALRREDQEYFDRLFRRVRCYTQAATYQASDNPMEAILLSIALDQEKRLDVLERTVQPPEVLHLPEPPAGSTFSLNASREVCDLQEKLVEQLDVSRSTGEDEYPDTDPQPNAARQLDPRQQLGSGGQLDTDRQRNTTAWLDFRSVPEPARDEVVVDRAESETPLPD